MARLGMDVDAVSNVATQLGTQADQIDALVAKINGIVATLPGIWDGPDSQQFVNDWWPQHKKELNAASVAIRGLSQSAKNNVTQQQQASGRY